MKRLVLSAAVIVSMLLLGLYNGYYIQNLTNEIIYQLSCAQSTAEEERWDAATRITQQAYENWNRHHSYLHIVSRHNDTDEILRTFQAVLQYLKIQETDQYTAANIDLITQLQLLAEMEQPTLVNIL